MFKVMVNPGHGGTAGNGDPGAVYNKVEEDDLNLAIGKLVFNKLIAAKCDAVLTRSTDVFVSIPVVISKEHAYKPDCFVSIHCNAAKNKSANGYEVWAWIDSTKGTALAKSIKDSLSSSGLKNRGVYYSDDDSSTWQRKLAVLADTNSPATLVECGYLSNDSDRAVLTNPIMQDKIATLICKGILAWLKAKK